MIDFKWKFLSIALVCVLAAGFVAVAPYASAQVTINSNSLFVGDHDSQSVKLVDVQTAVTSNFATSNINTPNGIIFTGTGVGSVMLIANQFAGTKLPGDIAKYDPSNGNFLGFLVPQSDPNAPHAPRGIVLSPDHKTLYVADLTETIPGGSPAGRSAQTIPAAAGLIRTYDMTHNGAFIASYSAQGLLRPLGDQFNPKGLVFGPDGLLYISVFDTRNSSTGYILTFNPSNQQFKILVANPGSANTVASIHRPEGIVFDPSGKSLWVTSFCPHDPKTGACLDVDKIMEFGTSGGPPALVGKLITSISLDVLGSPRTFAQAILFGPNLGTTNENLYVPISNTGELRVYETQTASFTFTSVPTSTTGPNPLVLPWYLSFRGTDPSTLAFTTAVSALSSSPSSFSSTQAPSNTLPIPSQPNSIPFQP